MPAQRSRRRVIVLAFVVAIVTGCGAVVRSATQPNETTSAVTVLRSDADGRGLMAISGGSPCDGSRLEVQESAGQVLVQERTTESRNPCAAVFVPSRVYAPLGSPLGTRPVLSGDWTVPVFDGARLLIPQRVPQGYAVVDEAVDPNTLAEGPRTRPVDAWTQVWGMPWTDEVTEPFCDERDLRLTVRVGDTPAPPMLDFGNERSIDGGALGPATTREQFFSPGHTDARSVELMRGSDHLLLISSGKRCGFDGPLSEQDLLAVAASLHPAA